jgi:hypothetical protein
LNQLDLVMPHGILLRFVVADEESGVELEIEVGIAFSAPTNRSNSLGHAPLEATP